MNLAARAGRWSAAHWKTATLGWLAFVVAAVMLGSLHGTISQTDAEQTSGQAARAEQMLAAAHVKDVASENVLVRSGTLTASSPAFRRTVADVRSTITRTANVRHVHLGDVSKDGHLALVGFDIGGNADTADARVQPALDAAGRLARAHPGYAIAEVGDASISKAMNGVLSSGLSHAEKLSLPITFAILLLAFGAFLAAGVPVLLAFTAVLAALGLTHLSSSFIHEADPTASVILLMGMAVGVDYSLFYLKREREERGKGASREEALQRAAATSGRAVLVSGLTVMTAAGGLMLEPFDTLGPLMPTARPNSERSGGVCLLLVIVPGRRECALCSELASTNSQDLEAIRSLGTTRGALADMAEGVVEIAVPKQIGRAHV